MLRCASFLCVLSRLIVPSRTTPGFDLDRAATSVYVATLKEHFTFVWLLNGKAYYYTSQWMTQIKSDYIFRVFLNQNTVSRTKLHVSCPGFPLRSGLYW